LEKAKKWGRCWKKECATQVGILFFETPEQAMQKPLGNVPTN
jgi:hypothetical protein